MEYKVNDNGDAQHINLWVFFLPTNLWKDQIITEWEVDQAVDGGSDNPGLDSA